MAIPQTTADIIMVKCGRRCCICRRFAPLHLQIHHIIEQNAGGGDEEENLVPVCLTCHSDSHTRTTLSRRFTAAELCGHRDSLFAAVAAGTLSTGELIPSDLDRIAERVLSHLRATAGHPIATSVIELKETLSAEAVSILLAAVRANDGLLAVMPTPHGLLIQAGESHLLDRTDPRKEAAYRDGLEELMTLRLLAYQNASKGETLRVVTRRGYLLADQIMAGAAAEGADPG